MPESRLRPLPEVLTGLDTLELGCGTGYVSGAGQLRIARVLQREHGLLFPLVQADAERPPLVDCRFDLVVSEYGLTGSDLWRWVPEAARLLRPGRPAARAGHHAAVLECTPTGGPAADRLTRDYFGLHALHVIDEQTLEFQLPYGEWIRCCASAVSRSRTWWRSSRWRAGTRPDRSYRWTGAAGDAKPATAAQPAYTLVPPATCLLVISMAGSLALSVAG